MKANGLSKWAAASAAMVMAIQAMGQAATTTLAASGQAKRNIVVSLEDRKLAVVEDGKVKKVYTVAVGKPSTPSPVGTFTIQRRVKNPVYQHDGKVVQPGPGNPVGTRWMGLNIKGYGIHGTNEPKSIGKAASHGCIRMARKDLEEMYEMIGVGDTVELVGQRNEETAELFGEPLNPAEPGQPVVATNVEPASTTIPSASAMVATTDSPSNVAESGVAATGNW